MRSRILSPLKVSTLYSWFIPETAAQDTEMTRLSKLLIGFGFLGAFFGAAYSLLYFAIDHPVGALIIILCSSIFAVMPWILKVTENTIIAGNLFCGVLITGFTLLTAIEGGVRGHAVAWLGMTPLCAILLCRRRRHSIFWSVSSILIVTLFCVLEQAGYLMPYLYPDVWHLFLTSLGFIGLTLFLFFLGMIYENSRQKAMEEKEFALFKLQEANEELIQLNQEKNEFLGIAAHDLKNPLASIRGFAGLITSSDEIQRDDINEYAGFIEQASTRMSDIISKVLDVNAIEQGKYPIQIDTHDISTIANYCATNNDHAARTKSITLVKNLHPLEARVDSSALQQVIDNLLSNAIKFSSPGDRVWIRSMREEQLAVLEVEDEGPGMSPDDKKKLFKRFSKLSARPTGGESSSGLGLSIVKKLIEEMNGTIICTSELGKGTVFRISFPLPSEKIR